MLAGGCGPALTRISRGCAGRAPPAAPAPAAAPRHGVRPPPRATDLEMIELEVYGAACTILAPASWCWPSPAKATESTSPLACSPATQQAGPSTAPPDPS